MLPWNPERGRAQNDDGTIEIWGGHQLPDVYQNLASEIAGVPSKRSGSTS